MEKLIIIGGVGFGEEIAWLIERINDKKEKFEILGFINNDIKKGDYVGKYIVLGNDDLLYDLPKDTNVCIAIGNSIIRQKVTAKIKKLGFKFPILIDPSAIINNKTIIKEGAIICANCVITTNVMIEEFVLINLACTIGHDCTLENFSTILPGCNISGNVTLKECCSLGTGVKVIPHCQVGKNAIVGAGGIVVKNIPDNCTAVGVPAKPLGDIYKKN